MSAEVRECARCLGEFIWAGVPVSQPGTFEVDAQRCPHCHEIIQRHDAHVKRTAGQAEARQLARGELVALGEKLDPAVRGSDPLAACGSLRDAATPELYTRNAFRITGLPVDATTREIARQVDKLKMLAELGGDDSAAAPRAFALEPAPDVEKIREAVHRLKEPEQRLVDEFFWFWPMARDGGADDAALGAIAAGDQKRAFECWTSWLGNPEAAPLAAHNLAVAMHLAALDWTAVQLAGDVDDARGEKIKGYWSEAWKYWSAVFGDERIAGRLQASIAAVNDPRLPSAFGQQLLDAAPHALAKIQGELALRFADRSERSWAEYHVSLMRTHAAGAYRAASEVMLARGRNTLRQLCTGAEERTAAHPSDGAQSASELLAAARPIVDRAALFLGAASPGLAEIADELAATALASVSAYRAATKDDATVVSVLEAMQPLPLSNELRQRLERNIRAARRSLAAAQVAPLLQPAEAIAADRSRPASARLHALKREIIPAVIGQIEREAEAESTAALRNELAVALLGLSAEAHTQEHDATTAMQAIMMAARLATDPELTATIEAAIPAVRQSFDAARCHFCRNRPAEKRAGMAVQLYGDVTRQGGKVQFRQATITVPRCRECQRADHLNVLTAIVLGGIGAGCGALMPLASGAEVTGAWLFGGGLAGLVLGGYVYGFLNRRRKRRSDAEFYPVAELLSRGWKYGDGPGSDGVT